MNVEQFQEWRSHPTTIEVLAEIEKLRDTLRDHLVEGETLKVNAGETAQLTARYVGRIDGLGQLINYEYMDDRNQEEGESKDEKMG